MTRQRYSTVRHSIADAIGSARVLFSTSLPVLAQYGRSSTPPRQYATPSLRSATVVVPLA